MITLFISATIDSASDIKKNFLTKLFYLFKNSNITVDTANGIITLIPPINNNIYLINNIMQAYSGINGDTFINSSSFDVFEKIDGTWLYRDTLTGVKLLPDPNYINNEDDSPITNVIEKKFNVRDYGAVGDGVTDDTNAFNNAILAASNYNIVGSDIGVSVNVTVPSSPNVYVITNTLTVPPCVNIIGVDGTPYLKLGSNNVSDQMFNIINYNNNLDNLVLDGNDRSTDDLPIINYSSSGILSNLLMYNVQDGIYLKNCSNVLIENVSIYNSSNNGITIELCNYCEIHNCYLSGAGYGIWLVNSSFKNYIHGNYVEYSINGIFIDNRSNICYSNIIDNNQLDNNSGDALIVKGVTNIVTNNICNNNTGSGVAIYGMENIVANNILTNNAYAGADNGKAAITLVCNNGGLPQFNTITGNICDDSRTPPYQDGIWLSDSSYSLWVSGQTATIYEYYGLNLYNTTGTGITGNTPPTVTYGNTNDDNLKWYYIATALSSGIGAFNNIISDNNIIRFANNKYLDESGGVGDTANTISDSSLNLTARIDLTGSITIPANTALVRFTQATTVAAATLTLPTVTLDGYVIQFVNYAGEITSLTFSPTVNGWTDTNTLAAYTGLKIRWDAVTNAWYKE